MFTFTKSVSCIIKYAQCCNLLFMTNLNDCKYFFTFLPRISSRRAHIKTYRFISYIC